MNIDLHSLQALDKFQDSDLSSTFEDTLDMRIIGDHVYMITNNVNICIIAADLGNGHGQVLNIVRYNND